MLLTVFRKQRMNERTEVLTGAGGDDPLHR
jgi:hypothetical protein